MRAWQHHAPLRRAWCMHDLNTSLPPPLGLAKTALSTRPDGPREQSRVWAEGPLGVATFLTRQLLLNLPRGSAWPCHPGLCRTHAFLAADGMTDGHRRLQKLGTWTLACRPRFVVLSPACAAHRARCCRDAEPKKKTPHHTTPHHTTLTTREKGGSISPAGTKCLYRWIRETNKTQLDDECCHRGLLALPTKPCRQQRLDNLR